MFSFRHEDGPALDEAALGGVVFAAPVHDHVAPALPGGGPPPAAAYLECAVGDRILWGVGVDANIVTASLKAVVSAVNRATAG